MRSATILAAVLMLPALALAQTTWYVPDDFPAGIQAAISDPSVVNGDTVIVRAGTYYENIDFLGKAITLRSEDGPETTIIDGSQVDTVVTFVNGETALSVLDGFTVNNGDDHTNHDGGGLFLIATSPKIINNVIHGNTDAGIYSDGGSPEIRNNTVLNNEKSGMNLRNGGPIVDGNLIKNNGTISSYTGDGGLYCYKLTSDAVISNNVIRGNYGENLGGGISCRSCKEMTIRDNLISGNTSPDGGGIGISSSVYVYAAGPVVSGNTIVFNHAIWFHTTTGSVGGVYIWRSNVTLVGNIIAGNVADTSIGGIAIYTGSSLIADNIIAFNDGGGHGGAVFCDLDNIGGTPNQIDFVNNTIVSNSKGHSGIECYGESDCQVNIVNTIIWGNAGGYEIEMGGCEVTISHSDLQGGQASIDNNGGTLNWDAPSMIDADPLFIDQASKDLHLTYNSPCRNAGDGVAAGLSLEDFEGDPRIAGSAPDIGADEFHHHLYQVGQALPGSQVSLRVVGPPGKPVAIYRGSGIQDPPQSTQYGDLYLQLPPLKKYNPGSIPANGVLIWDPTIPSGISPGSEFPMQALVGPLGNSTTRLTNLLVLEID